MEEGIYRIMYHMTNDELKYFEITADGQQWYLGKDLERLLPSSLGASLIKALINQRQFIPINIPEVEVVSGE